MSKPQPQPTQRQRPRQSRPRSKSRWQITMEMAEAEAEARKLKKRQQNQKQLVGGSTTTTTTTLSSVPPAMMTQIPEPEPELELEPARWSLFVADDNSLLQNHTYGSPTTTTTTTATTRPTTPTTEEITEQGSGGDADDENDDEEENDDGSSFNTNTVLDGNILSHSASMTVSIGTTLSTQQQQGGGEEEKKEEKDREHPCLGKEDEEEEELEIHGKGSSDEEQQEEIKLKKEENTTLKSCHTHDKIGDDDCNKSKGSTVTVNDDPAAAAADTTATASVTTPTVIIVDGDGVVDDVAEAVEEQQEQQQEQMEEEERNDTNDYSKFVYSFLMGNKQHPEEEIVYYLDDGNIVEKYTNEMLLSEQDNNNNNNNNVVCSKNNMKSPQSKTKKKHPSMEVTSPSTPTKTPKKKPGKKVCDKDIMKTPKSKTKTKKKSHKNKKTITEASGITTTEIMDIMGESNGNHNGECSVVEIRHVSPTTSTKQKMKKSPTKPTRDMTMKSPTKTPKSKKKSLTPKGKHKKRIIATTSTTTGEEPNPEVDTKADVEATAPEPSEVSCYFSLTTMNERQNETEHSTIGINNDTTHSGDTSTEGETSFYDDVDLDDGVENRRSDDGIDDIIAQVHEKEEKQVKETFLGVGAELQADLDSSPSPSPSPSVVLPLRRHHSLPMHRQQSSRGLPLGIETIHEVHDEIDRSPVKETKSSISLTSFTQHNDKRSTAKSPVQRLTMDELRASLHMAAKEAADVGNHTKLSEKVVEAVAPDDSSSFDSDDDDDDWDGFGGSADESELDSEFDEFSIQVDADGPVKNESSSTGEKSSKLIERGEDLKSPSRQSTHQRRQAKIKDADEWKLKHGLAVENDLSRSNHFRVINEAAAVGSMKRLKAVSTEWKDKTDVEDASKTHTGEDNDDGNGNGKIPVFLKRRRKLLLKTSDRMDKFLEDAKLEKKKTMYAPEHVIERLREYEEISERFAGGDYGFLPASEPPSFQKPKVWIGQNRIRSTVVQDAVKEAENRNQRLTTSFHLQVRKKCPCKYCKSPNPFQTVAYQELRQEQRQKQKKNERKIVPKSPKRRPDDLSNTIHSSHPAGLAVSGSIQSPYSRTLLRSTSQVFKRGGIENAVTMKELKSPVWASPTLKKAVKIEKCEVSKTPIWAEATGKRDDSLPEWASDDLRKMIENEHKQKTQTLNRLEVDAVGNGGSGVGNEHIDGVGRCHNERKDDVANPVSNDDIVEETIVSSSLSNERQQQQQQHEHEHEHVQEQKPGLEGELEPQRRNDKGERSRKAIKSERRAKKWKNTRKGKAYRDKKEKKKTLRSGTAIAATG